MRTILFARESPVRSRLAQMIAELRGIQLDVEDPDLEKAYSIVRKVHPSVIVVDVDAAHGHGLEIIRRCSAHEGQGTVVMAIANSRSLEYRASCLAAGALFFFNPEREEYWLLDALESLREQVEQ
jgi:chemotaxis response regulator CheB